MREIKFRAWWIKEKVMINDLEAIYPKGKCAGILGIKKIKGESLWNFEDIEIMQFTGLHDKNGKEIWEGDIVKTLQPDEIGTVEYVDIRASFELKIKGQYYYQPLAKWKKHLLEVIGNIYENPELLLGVAGGLQ